MKSQADLVREQYKIMIKKHDFGVMTRWIRTAKIVNYPSPECVGDEFEQIARECRREIMSAIHRAERRVLSTRVQTLHNPISGVVGQ